MSQARSHRLFAAVYDRINAPLEREVLRPRRKRLLPQLGGEVLEVGAGTGASLPYFERAARVVASEPDPAMRLRMRPSLAEARVPVEMSDAAAERLPFDDASFDAIVFVCTLCTVADPERALAEARRVIRDGGRLFALEHVRGEARLARWQDRITPLWSRIAAGCHPNRETTAIIEAAGFRFERIERFDPFPAWIPTRPMVELVAHPV